MVHTFIHDNRECRKSICIGDLPVGMKFQPHTQCIGEDTVYIRIGSQLEDICVDFNYLAINIQTGHKIEFSRDAVVHPIIVEVSIIGNITARELNKDKA